MQAVVHACVRACVRVCVRACVRACNGVRCLFKSCSVGTCTLYPASSKSDLRCRAVMGRNWVGYHRHIIGFLLCVLGIWLDI